jgi:serine/threonine-protein kinase
MDSARFDKIRKLFEDAVELPPQDQRAFLGQACEDESVRAEVLRMLAADNTRNSVLDLSIGHAAHLALGRSQSYLSRQFGPYRTTEFLGEGGMGVVYLAERTDIGGRAAIKILRDSSMSPARRARFAEEQRTLARLSHSSVARIYDADILPDGTPWFAMEYVEGVSLTEYFRRLPLLQRLGLFREVCEAVRYAHSQLIVHRDLKPSNILVTKDGCVKLLDFGIAKHIEDSQITTGGQTRTVLRLMTPSYASPEQIRGESTGIHTDIYALGVILYELLTGRRPFDLDTCSPGEADRIITQDDPKRPSSVAERDNTKGWADLDVLCLTAMHKDPLRRYRSAEALIRDIDHYTNEEPLNAQPESFRYVAGKFMRRNRRVLAATTAVVICIAVMALFFTVRLVNARDAARAAASRMERIQGFMLNLFEGGDSYAGPAESLRVVSLLDRGVQEARSLTHEPAVQADLNATLGGLYRKLGKIERADELLQTALHQRLRLFGPDHSEVADSLRMLGFLRLEQSRNDEAEQLMRRALDITQRRHQNDRIRMGNAMAALGKVLALRGAYEEAVPLLKQAIELQSSGPPSPESGEALTDLANTFYSLGRYDESEALNKKLLDMDRQLFGQRHPGVAIDLFNLGNIALDRGQYDDAERRFRDSFEMLNEWYGKENPRAASSLLMLGVALDSMGKTVEAESLYRQSLAIHRRIYEVDNVRTGQVLSYLGNNALKQGKLDEAESLFRENCELFKSILGEQHEFYLIQQAKLGDVYVARGEYEKAEAILHRAADALRARLRPDHRYTAIAEIALGRALAGQKRYQEAEPHLLLGHKILQKHARASVPEIRSAREALFAVYNAMNEPAKATDFRN